jgi:hypothetical protein
MEFWGFWVGIGFFWVFLVSSSKLRSFLRGMDVYVPLMEVRGWLVLCELAHEILDGIRGDRCEWAA